MSTTTRIGTASLFALIAAASIVSPGAAAPATNPDPTLCAEYLKDLKTYRRMAELLGCDIPGGDAAAATTAAPAKLAAAPPDEVSFPPVEAEPTAPATDFPPVEDVPESAESTPSLPPVEQASTDPEPAEMPPVVDEPSHSSSGSSGGSSPSFPETAEFEPEAGFEEPSGPQAEVRTAIEEKIAEMKEEAKARVKEAVLAKAEEVKERVKERVKEKIRRKIEDAIFPSNDGADNPGVTFRKKAEKRFKTAAKDAVKKLVKEHHGKDKGGSLLNKLAQFRRH